MENVTTIHNYTNHSGGAIGADYQWGFHGKEYGVESNHYYIEGFKTPYGNYLIPRKLASEADEHLINVNKKILHRTYPTHNIYVNSLLRRNWWQVKNSDVIYAIAKINNNIVDGGTGWAVHMGIELNRPVYVFNQDICQWFTYDYSTNKFKEYNDKIFIASFNFAGIGTREINDNGIDAIIKCYKNTFGE